MRFEIALKKNRVNAALRVLSHMRYLGYQSLKYELGLHVVSRLKQCEAEIIKANSQIHCRVSHENRIITKFRHLECNLTYVSIFVYEL